MQTSSNTKTATAAELEALFTAVDVEVAIAEWHPLPDDRAFVLTGEPGGEGVVISNYYSPTDPRPMLCRKHGIARHDWTGKAFTCAKCGAK